MGQWVLNCALWYYSSTGASDVVWWCVNALSLAAVISIYEPAYGATITEDHALGGVDMWSLLLCWQHRMRFFSLCGESRIESESLCRNYRVAPVRKPTMWL